MLRIAICDDTIGDLSNMVSILTIIKLCRGINIKLNIQLLIVLWI
ncbi:hypothetical protein SAMN05660297_03193 [Natronincola peptidivorans]|uniref:Uncharacterized protein n=1 Tax=Natronincola peptidivorans TaxID=426128 RepID=A0A1I0GG95_9FIRM|nr:hypothetical protein SAMN05660297_03193 [Natronincola peptidivorans]